MNSLISRLQRPGYDLQKEQAIQEAIVMLRQCNAQSKPDCGEAGHDEGRCGNVQCLPGAAAPSVKESIIDDLQAQFNTEGITESDSGDALIRLSDAIAAVEDNFTQPAWGSQAVLDVTAERRRQIEVEGWTPEHDDEHSSHALAEAAACYCLSSAGKPFDYFETTWPWERWWFKASGTRRDLVKAGALILAEVERLDRAAEVGRKMK